jgi:N-acyl-D-aspartate/D-glutamate deacylase
MATSPLTLRGGRVIDPETGFDAAADVTIGPDGRIDGVHAPGAAPAGPAILDVTGTVVAPGFIDVHSHSHTLAGQRLQLLDGVTTVLELEVGVLPVERAHQRAAAEGRVAHYGYATSWAIARMAVLAGHEPGGRLQEYLDNIADPRWQRPAGPAEIERILRLLDDDLAAGAIGIGIMAAFAPHASPEEIVAVAQLAARHGVPTFTHARDLVEINPGTLIDGALEIVRAAERTGAQMHYCHVHSSSGRHLDRVLDTVGAARADGARISTEAYPYGAGMTGIGAAFLGPERLASWGLAVTDLTYAPTGERIADAARLRHLRATDPGGLVIVDFLREEVPADRDRLHRALTAPDGLIASDAMPLVWRGPPRPDAWPVPADATTHPRTAGTFTKALRLLHRHAGLPLPDVLRRATILPARLLEGCVPAMRRKGRLRAGADADLVVFDPHTVSEQATYARSTRVATGVRHVFVCGTPVVRDGAVVIDARPGRPLRAAPR